MEVFYPGLMTYAKLRSAQRFWNPVLLTMNF